MPQDWFTANAPKVAAPPAPAASGDWFAANSPQSVKNRPLLMGMSDAGIAQQLPNTPDAVQQVRAAQAPLETAAAGVGAAALGGTVIGGSALAQNPIVQGIGRTALYGGGYQAGRALGIPPDVLNGLMMLAGAREGVGALLRGRGSAPDAPEVSPNAGGRVVPRQEPSLNDVIGDALDALRKPEPTKVGTLPPQPSLPPGYTPRTSVPSPSGLASMQVAAPTPAPTAPVATPQALAPAPAAPTQALPGAWAQFAKPAEFPPKEIEGSGLAAAFDQELAKRGMAASDAIPLVKRNTALPSDVRTQLVSALEKVARKQAGVSVPSMTDPTLPAAWQALIQK